MIVFGLTLLWLRSVVVANCNKPGPIVMFAKKMKQQIQHRIVVASTCSNQNDQPEM
jgi:hypothetical protein